MTERVKTLSHPNGPPGAAEGGDWSSQDLVDEERVANDDREDPVLNTGAEPEPMTKSGLGSMDGWEARRGGVSREAETASPDRPVSCRSATSER